ncbi:MAG TPA: hypothetical protein VIQ80_02965, partial [Candidatus Saccharimonadales bacterium]
MSRLPTPGSDSNTWGSILNDYLSQSHNTDGTLKNSSVSAAQIQDASIPASKMDTTAQANLTKASTSAQITGGNTLTGTWDFSNTSVRLKPWQFCPDDYGAYGDGTHDDTAAVRAAWSAGITYAQSHQNYFELILSNKIYLLASPPTTANAGNAIISMPIVPTSGTKLIAVIRGGSEASVLPHWQQTVAQKAGPVLITNLTGLTVDATYGLPSVIGGPTPQQGYGTGGTFNNMMIRVDGVTVVCPANPTLAAFDFRGMAEASIGTVAALVNDVPSNLLNNAPTHSWSTGIFMPALLNYADQPMESMTVEGYYYGYSLGPHVAAKRLFAAYCAYAFYIPASGSDKHGVSVLRAEAEECNTALVTDGSAGPNTPVWMNLDCETINHYASVGTGYHINDANGALGGTVFLNDSGGNQGTYLVNGGGNLEILAQNQPRGNVTPPVVPASTTA